MEIPQTQSSSRPDRKTVERNRRIYMNLLCSMLESLIPPSHTPRGASRPLPNRLDEAVSYIKALQERVEKMKKRKKQLLWGEGSSQGMSSETAGGIRLSHVEVRDLGHGLQVVLVSNPSDRVVFYEVVRVLVDEGAEVLNASVSVVGDKAFHTILTSVVDVLKAGKVLEKLELMVKPVASCMKEPEPGEKKVAKRDPILELFDEGFF